MITLKEYLEKDVQSRRWLVVSDLNRGHALLRAYEKNTGKMVKNVTCKTLQQLSKELYLYILAKEGFVSENQLLSEEDAFMLFRRVLFQKLECLQYFNDSNMLNIATTREIFSKVQLIRENGWTGAEKEKSNKRVADLKYLVQEYEEAMQAESKLDSVAQLRFVLEKIIVWESRQEEIPKILGSEISCLLEETEVYSGLQKLFLKKLTDAQVVVFGEQKEKCLPDLRGKIQFFRGYGAFNEASYVVNDILEKKLPFGKVTLLYTTPSQIPSIEAAVRGNGLKAAFLSSYPLKNNPYIALARRMVAWAKDDFSEKKLEELLMSSILIVTGHNKEEEEINLLGGGQYFSYVSDSAKRRAGAFQLGWGYERNLLFVKQEMDLPDVDENQKNLLAMHKALLDIFGKDGKPYDDQNKGTADKVFAALVQFIQTYTKNTRERGEGLEALKRLQSAVALESRVLTGEEILEYLEELFSTINHRDSVEQDAISIKCISDWMVLDRPYVYIIGLSLKDMQGNTTESPVLFDGEIREFLGEGYKPTVKAVAERKEKNFYRTLQTFTGEQIVLGYSSYDTVAFCENNPSSFYRELLEQFGAVQPEELVEFVYGNPEGEMEGYGLQDETAEEQEPYEVRVQTSSSTLEMLLECPKKYAYNKQLFIPDEEIPECDYSKWLDAKQYGTFFHSLAEKYVNGTLIKKASEAYDSTVNAELLRELAVQVKEEMKREVPVAFPELADREAKQIVDIAIPFFQRLHDELLAENRRVLAAEQAFENATYLVKAYDDKEYIFSFSGIIDRIDYRLDKDEKKVYLRLVDYKTGKKESKERDLELGKVIQHAIYKKALMETGKYSEAEQISLLDYLKGKIARLEENIQNIENWEYAFESFLYVFPKEMINTEPITIEGNVVEDRNLIRLRAILTAISELKYYPDHMDLFLKIKEYAAGEGCRDAGIVSLKAAMEKKDKSGTTQECVNGEEIYYCKYCEYGELCARRKSGEFSD